jgi:membrane-associated phospholipid phosphatase
MDSFPSGHALQVGALAASLHNASSPSTRLLIWPTAVALASTRVLLLAHYVTDIAAGLVLGALVRGIVGKLFPRRSPAPEQNSGAPVGENVANFPVSRIRRGWLD